MAPRRVDERLATEWRGVIGRQERSGLSIREVCRQEDLAEARFYWWRREFERWDKTAAAPGGRPARKPVPQTAALQFLPVTGTPAAAVVVYELLLPGGARVLIYDAASKRLVDRRTEDQSMHCEHVQLDLSKPVSEVNNSKFAIAAPRPPLGEHSFG